MALQLFKRKKKRVKHGTNSWAKKKRRHTHPNEAKLCPVNQLANMSHRPTLIMTTTTTTQSLSLAIRCSGDEPPSRWKSCKFFMIGSIEMELGFILDDRIGKEKEIEWKKEGRSKEEKLLTKHKQYYTCTQIYVLKFNRTQDKKRSEHNRCVYVHDTEKYPLALALDEREQWIWDSGSECTVWRNGVLSIMVIKNIRTGGEQRKETKFNALTQNIYYQLNQIIHKIGRIFEIYIQIHATAGAGAFDKKTEKWMLLTATTTIRKIGFFLFEFRISIHFTCVNWCEYIEAKRNKQKKCARISMTDNQQFRKVGIYFRSWRVW